MIVWYLVVYTATATINGLPMSGSIIDCMLPCRFEQKEMARVRMPDVETCRAIRGLNNGSKCVAEATD